MLKPTTLSLSLPSTFDIKTPQPLTLYFYIYILFLHFYILSLCPPGSLILSHLKWSTLTFIIFIIFSSTFYMELYDPSIRGVTPTKMRSLCRIPVWFLCSPLLLHFNHLSQELLDSLCLFLYTHTHATHTHSLV